MTVVRELAHAFRVLWRIGGPIGLLTARLDGTLDAKIEQHR